MSLLPDCCFLGVFYYIPAALRANLLSSRRSYEALIAVYYSHITALLLIPCPADQGEQVVGVEGRGLATMRQAVEAQVLTPHFELGEHGQ